jgi:nucleoside-diphosphate kinase
MQTERTFAMLKPGVLQRRIAGEVLQRLEMKGFKIIGMKLMRISKELAEKQYAEHRGKDFYAPLMDYTSSGPVVVMVLERPDAIAALRRLAGPTLVDAALPGTIRGDYGVTTRKNIIHASDSRESAEREIGLFFKPEEIHEYEDGNEQWY